MQDQNESLNNLLPKVCLAPLSANNTQVMEKDGENVKKERKKSFLSLKYPTEFFHAKKFWLVFRFQFSNGKSQD